MARNLFPAHARCSGCNVLYYVDEAPKGVFFCEVFTKCVDAKEAYLKDLQPLEDKNAPGAPVDPAPAVAESSAPPAKAPVVAAIGKSA